ncbi:MAG: hypothetical protein ABEJ91_02900 [Candidatus Nanohaloarchaea archaeon]
MELKPLLKEWRIWVLLLSLFASTVFLGPHYARGPGGDIQLETNIQKGLELKGGIRVLLDVQGENITKTEVDQVKNVLQTRVSAFGLTQTDIRTVELGRKNYKIQIEVASTNRTQLRDLISRKGSFEARMPVPVTGTRYFNLSETHRFTKTSTGVTVEGKSYQPGDVFYLEGGEKNGTKFYFVNASNTTAHLEVVAYDGQDVQQVLTSDARVSGGAGNYRFRFPVVISSEAARNVKHVAQNYEVPLNAEYLKLSDGTDAKLRLYVDGKQQSALSMSKVFARKTITQPSINGGAESAAKARQEMKELQAILRSGRLEHPVEIESISSISSSLGDQFMSAAVISILASLVAVGGLVYARYRDLRTAVPIFVTGSSEVFILIGSWFSVVATLDLASIAGIIAAVGTGVDDQIIIADESGREKVRSWKERMKRAFFVIFTSAASTIGAMMPLVTPELSYLAIGAAGLGLLAYTFSSQKSPQYLVVGTMGVTVAAVAQVIGPSGFALQAVRGFAITTILGVLVGISITRPAYAKLLEHLKD